MNRERPVSVLILALVSIVVAGLCLFAGTARTGRWIINLALPASPRDGNYYGMYRDRSVPIPDLETYLEQEVPGYEAWETAVPLAMLAGGLMLLVVSIGLLHMGNWARWVGLAYALAVIVWQLLYLRFQLAAVLPVADLYYLDESWRSYFYGPSMEGTARFGFLLVLAIPAVLLIGHAALLTSVLFLMPSVRRAFTAPVDELASPVKLLEEKAAEPAGSSV